MTYDLRFLEKISKLSLNSSSTSLQNSIVRKPKNWKNKTRRRRKARVKESKGRKKLLNKNKLMKKSQMMKLQE
jgi:hypothetical protein